MTVETLSNIRLESLRDGTTVVLRPPELDDVERSLAFFRALPKSDRRYLRFDVTRRDVVERLIREAVEEKAHRILALDDSKVVGHGALELSRDSWQSHLGEIRVIVRRGYRRRGLGALLICSLFQAAEERDVEKVVVRLAGSQHRIRRVCERLGFVVEAVLRDHFKDADGERQDLIVMSCNLDEVSRTLRQLCAEEAWHPLD